MNSKIILAATAAYSVCAQAQTAEFDAAKAFGARPAVEDVGLSPDGTKISFIAPTTGQGSALYVTDVASGAPPVRALSASGNPERLQWCNWVANDRLACKIYGVQKNNALLYAYSRLFAVNTDGSNARMISTRDSSDALGFAFGGGNVVDWLPDDDGVVLMSRNYVPQQSIGSNITKEQTGLAVDRVDTRTARSTRVEQPKPMVSEYIGDGLGTIRIMGNNATRGATGYASSVISYSFRKKGSREWLKLGELDFQNGTGFNPYAVDPDRDVVFGLMKKDGRWAAYEMALDGSGATRLVYSRPDVDVDGFAQIGHRRRVVGVSYTTDVGQVQYIDPQAAKLHDMLHKALPGQPNVAIIDASKDEGRLLIQASSDDDAGTYYLFDKASKKLQRLLAVRPELEGQKLAEMKSVSYTASDGVSIPAYLTLPVGGTGRNLPAIVMPHGGPGSRDSWGFDWLVQFYASRGYAVLQPQFRGSTGYGDQWFEKNGFQSWRKAIGDVDAAGRWLVSQGIADATKLAAVGWSYGGYAVLQSAVTEPGLYKAVVAIAPVTDLATLKTESVDWSNHVNAAEFIGAGLHIREGSPAQNAERIKVPVILFHGTFDRNVDVKESRLMDDRLTAAHVPHELVIYDSLDHYLEDSAVRTDMLRKSDAFLRKSMGMAAN